MFTDGDIRIASASSYDDPSLNSAIRDSELAHHAFLKVDSGGFHVLRKDSSGREKIMSQYDGNVQFNVSRHTDFYVFCLASRYDFRLIDDFDADSMIVVDKPEIFKRRVAEAVAKELQEWRFTAKNVDYYDPFFVNPHRLGTGFSKHFRYSYQNEFRMMRSSPKRPPPLNPFFIKIGSMHDFASYYSLPAKSKHDRP
jgi:hypothetical protein